MIFMKAIAFFFFLNLAVPVLVARAQADTLFYSAPPEVRQLIIKYLNEQKTQGIGFYGTWVSSVDTVSILIHTFGIKNGGVKPKEVGLSGRFLKLNSQGLSLPLLLGSDMYHSEAYFKIWNMDQLNEIHSRTAWLDGRGYLVKYIRGIETEILFAGWRSD
jgi:hypothetical protein